MADKNGNGSKADTKALFGALIKAQKAVSAAQVALTKAQDEQSQAVAAVSKACGTGPFDVPGMGLISLVARYQKDEEGNSIAGSATYFIKRHGKQEVQKIEL